MLATATYGVPVDDLVGRDTELDRLRALVEATRTGAGAAALIEGEPGIGKSSLARATANLAERRGCRVLWAAADELGQALPLRPLLDACHDLPAPRLTAIRSLLRGEFTGNVDAATAASEQFLALLAELAHETPTLLVVDDLQWADRATVALVDTLARTAARLPLLVLGVLRPVPDRREVAPLRRVIETKAVFRLAGLRPDSVSQLLTGLAGGQPGESLLKVAADAGGNPLYVTELVDALVRARRLMTGEGALVEVTDGPVPRSLLGAIADRLDFLSGDIRTMLHAAALLGVEFLAADLAVVRNRRIPDLVPDIHRARTAGVLEDRDEKLAFRHPLIRAALYDEIASTVRPAWHRDAARALAAAGAPVHRVARQLLQAVAAPEAGPLDEVLLDWLAGAASALVAQTPATAINLLRAACRDAAVTTDRGARLASRLAEALYRSGDGEAAERVARQVMGVASDPDLVVDLHWTMSQARALLGRADESLKLLGQAVDVPGVAPRQRARLLVLAARAHRDLGEVEVAGELAARALATAEEACDLWSVGWSLHVQIVVSMMQGNVDTALPLFDRALDVVGEDPALADLGLLLRINQAVAFGDLDRYDDAVRVATNVRRMADQAGSVVRLAQARCALGELLFEAGQWDDALTEIRALPDEVKDPGVTCCDRGAAAAIAFHRGDLVAAREHLRRATSNAKQLGNRVVAPLVLAKSLDHEVDSDLTGALDVLTRRLAGTEELDEVEDLLPEAARLAVLTGANEVARDVTVRAAELAGRGQVPHRQGSAAYCRGLLDRSAALLLLAGDKFADAGRPLWEAKALEAAALVLVGDGDRGAARVAFTRADEIYERLGAVWDVARLRAALRRYGIRRGPRNPHRQASTGWGSLTPGEERVARLVADGLANREIAERLVLSVRTVESHVSHILAKLGMRSRVDIVRGGIGGQAGAGEGPA